MAFLDLMAFKEELACSTCLRYLTKPIAVECGHKFCFECLFQSWKEIPDQGTYHQCKDIYKLKDPRYSLQLGMMAELAKTLRPHLMDVKNSLCSIHEEKAKSFCVEDQVLLCEVCFLFLEHQSHVVLTTGEKKEAFKAPSSSLRKHQPRINFPKEVLKGLSMHQGWLERRRGFPVGVTLDGETASPYLVVSPDLKS